jgi:DNA-binding transcriptional MerR regulator
MDATENEGRIRGSKGRDAFKTISEVAEELDLPQHVLRFWESKFNQIKPLKRGGNRRYYRPDDVMLLTTIKRLLHSEGYTIRGVQKLFKAQGLKATIDRVLAGTSQPILESMATEPQTEVSASSAQYAHVPSIAPLQSALTRLKKLRSTLSD